MANLSDLIRVLSPTTSNYGLDSGSVNTYEIDVVPAITEYVIGEIYAFKATNTNTGSSTFNICSVAATTIKRNGGVDNLLPSDIIAGQIVTVMYDGVYFQMLSDICVPFTYSIRTPEFTLDSTDIGSDFGTAFSGMVSSIDFEPDVQGTVWTHVNLGYAKFDPNKDIYVDLHHVFDGTIGMDLAVRLQIRAWVVNNGDAPVLGSPTDDVTSDVTIEHTNTNKILDETAILTISESDLSASADTLIIAVTRLATHINDTYTGTYQLMNIFLRQ